MRGIKMAKILIIYDSRTGNTEKMARAVAKGARQIKDTKVNVKKVEETTVPDLPKADAIVFGSPTYFGEMSGKLKAFIDESVKVYGKLQGKVGAVSRVLVETRRAQKLPCSQ
jgi:NAD(P)H dehydrogenase (quinone)